MGSEVFAGIIGHPSVVAFLGRDALRPAQAYLFVGPSNTGKAAVARRFAAALMCDGDGACERRVVAGNHPDLVVVEPEGRAAITVEQARHTVSQASLAPLVGSRKVFLFEEGGAMNDEAANALLKTLEEPTASTIFIIVTESEDDLPDTIASRCRTVVFGRVAEEVIADGLQARGLDAVQAEQAARISGGRPGLAVALATQPAVAAYRHAWLSVPLRLSALPGDAYVLADEVASACEPLLKTLRDDHAARLAAAERDGAGSKALKDRHERELKRATSALYVSGLEILAGFYRDAAAAQFGAPARNTDVPATALADVLPATAVANAERVLETIEALEANQRPTLAFANLFADLGVTR
jgi:DNA polymerase-3 subunit delta'